jgi:Co/Zn/Cd efflux system component
MRSCCEISGEIPARQRRVLQIVLWVNAAMFVTEFGAGLVAHSTALLSDSVDMLGDAIAYGFSLYAVARGPVWQARAALLKGTIMAAFGLGVLAEVTLKVIRGVVPAITCELAMRRSTEIPGCSRSKLLMSTGMR